MFWIKFVVCMSHIRVVFQNIGVSVPYFPAMFRFCAFRGIARERTELQLMAVKELRGMRI